MRTVVAWQETPVSAVIVAFKPCLSRVFAVFAPHACILTGEASLKGLAACQQRAYSVKTNTYKSSTYSYSLRRMASGMFATTSASSQASSVETARAFGAWRS